MESLEGSVSVVRELPTVTGLMVVYNCPHFIGRALDSALGQDYPAELLDLVIVDDGCTDETPQVIEEYRRRHPERITVIRQANAGLVGATNTAVAAARAAILSGIDADDLWPEDKVRRQVARLMEDPSLGLVYCDTQVIGAQEQVLRRSYWESLGIKPQRGPAAYAQIMGYAGNIALNTTLAFRAELARRFFPIPLRVPFQDWWITAHIATVAGIDSVDGLQTGYRQHGGNATLGATGLWEVRETCKTAEMRRQMLIHGGGDHLDLPGLLVAWQAWEHSARVAVTQSGSAYVPLVTPTEPEIAQGARHAAAAEEATVAGELELALRERIRALACNPHDRASRRWVHELTWLGEADHRKAELRPDPLAGARRFVTLAYVEELTAEPQMLSAYASVFGEDDDATLAIAALGLGDERALNAISGAVERAGLDLDRLPDVLVVTSGGPAVGVELEARAAAVLTRREAKLRAPAVTPERASELRLLAGEQPVAAAA